MTSHILHATTVAIDGLAVLIQGPSGAGKSDLALRLIDRGATLVSDDRTVIESVGERLLASPPATIAGQLEVRGLGLVCVEHRARAPVALLVDLSDTVERLPEPETRVVAGMAVRRLALDPRPASAAIKVEWALRHRVEVPA